ncbi:MAG: TerD family protein, partial [Muribaculaceae bacterium]|nr:TerD family protein [Muribaculaceae bacterium]
GGVVNLPAGEFEGRFYVRKSCTVNGGGALLWNASGPVLVIEADNVSVNNLRAELTSDNAGEIEYISVFCKGKNPRFSEVEVNGSVLGIADEEQYWGVPRILELGKLPAEQSASFTAEIYVPVEAEIRSGIYGVTLSRDLLLKGYNSVTLTVGKIRAGSIIYGNIFVTSAVTGITRKIFVSGETGEGCVPKNPALYFVDRESPYNYQNALAKFDIANLAAGREAERVFLTEEERSPKPAEVPVNDNVEIVSGRRIPLAPRNYRIELLCRAMRMKLDVDAYLFMLNERGKVKDNSGMVFFRNTASPCGSVRYVVDGDRAMFVDFRAIPADVSKMSLLFSIYGDKNWQQFSKIIDGEISFLCENGVCLRMKLEKNINCRTILACGFERVDGVWELVPSGKGVAMELPDICRSYGVVVAE